MTDKLRLRAELRQIRRDHVAALAPQTRALVFHRPPAAIAALVADGAPVGLYHADGAEAPTRAYARWFHEHGHPIALPWFAGREAAMSFRRWRDPWDETTLKPGPWRVRQPAGAEDDRAEELAPALVFVPLLGFSADGARLGQGGGHYDRWLAAHPGVTAIGLAWDCQLVPDLPVEAHDHPLAAVITPTRLYESAADA